MIFPLSLLVFVIPSFLLQLKVFSISFETSSLARGLFRNMLLNFQVFVDFLVSFLLLASNSIMVREYALYIFNSFVNVHFMTQRTVYLVECSMYTGKECLFSSCCIECSINISEISSWLMVLFSSLFLLMFCISIDSGDSVFPGYRIMCSQFFSYSTLKMLF